MNARLLVVQHEDECGPAWLGEWLEEAGVEICVVHGHRGEAIPETTSGYDGLLVMGGDMGVYDDATCPWLTSTKRLVAHTVEAGTPFLGVCLGNQLAAVALGGSVAPNVAGAATGLTPVGLTAAGREDRLLGAVTPGTIAIQWNRDVVTELPPGATVLATAPDESLQAIRFADQAWGVQFHPEASPEVFATWTVDSPNAEHPRPDGLDVAAIAAAVARSRPALWAGWRPLGERFGAVVQAAHAREAPVAAS